MKYGHAEGLATMPKPKEKAVREQYRVILDYHDGEQQTVCDTHNPHTARDVFEHWKRLKDEAIERGERPWTVVLRQV